jgi:hypothetical protein
MYIPKPKLAIVPVNASGRAPRAGVDETPRYRCWLPLVVSVARRHHSAVVVDGVTVGAHSVAQKPSGMTLATTFCSADDGWR